MMRLHPAAGAIISWEPRLLPSSDDSNNIFSRASLGTLGQPRVNQKTPYDLKKAACMSTSLGSFKKQSLGNLLSITDNKQRAGDSGPPGLSGFHASFLSLLFSFFCYHAMSLSNTFSLCFPEAPGFYLEHYPKADQLNPVPPTGH
jgi:hypothetical protein